MNVKDLRKLLKRFEQQKKNIEIPVYRFCLTQGLWQRKVFKCSYKVWRGCVELWYPEERLWHMSWCRGQCLQFPVFV